jgi:predicted nuclease of predicted toxin-antitoxin system
MRISRPRPSPGYGIEGYDVSSVAEGHAGSADELVAAICDREERILLTFDQDFGDLVFRRGLSSGSSVVLLRIMPELRLVVDVIHSLIEKGNSHCRRVLDCGAQPSAR